MENAFSKSSFSKSHFRKDFFKPSGAPALEPKCQVKLLHRKYSSAEKFTIFAKRAVSSLAEGRRAPEICLKMGLRQYCKKQQKNKVNIAHLLGTLMKAPNSLLANISVSKWGDRVILKSLHEINESLPSSVQYDLQSLTCAGL